MSAIARLAETLSDSARAGRSADGNAALAIAARERLDAVLLDLRYLGWTA